MNVRFDEQKLCDVMKDFYNATGINIAMLDDNGTTILHEHKFFNEYCSMIQGTSHGRQNCMNSDKILLERCKKSKKIESHICHAGLMDIAIPILYNDTIVCYLIFGQIKCHQSFDSVKKYISSLPLDLNRMKYYYSSLATYDEKKFQSISNIAVMLSRYIIFEHMLKPDISENIDRVLSFINENLENKLNISDICKKTNISKSVLYKNFHTHFNCTVNEYIASERVRKSINMLLYTDLSIENIALSVGFSSSAYYTKMFKKFNGTTPLKYKNENKLHI